MGIEMQNRWGFQFLGRERVVSYFYFVFYSNVLMSFGYRAQYRFACRSIVSYVG
jgi:hypothetical protein